MPIDYLSKRKAAEKEVEDLLTSRKAGIGGEIAETAGRIEAGRQKFFGDVGVSQPSLAEHLPKLQRRTDETLAMQKMQRERQMTNMIYQQAFDLAQERGYDVRSAQEFARATLEQKRNQEFLASESAKGRESSERMFGMREEAVKRGMSLEEQYTPQTDQAAALMALLMGAGTSLGTAYYLSGRGGQQPQGGSSAGLKFAVSRNIQDYGVKYPGTARPTNYASYYGGT